MTSPLDPSLLEPWRRGGPGGVAALLRDGEIVAMTAEGRADLATGLRWTPDTPFHICSCTKQYTAVVLLLLEKRGLLSLDDDARRHVAGLPDTGTTITLRHLVTNTSGLRDYLAMPSLVSGRPARRVTEEMTRGLIFGQRTTMFAPGSAYRYSNTNFALLGWTIEAVTGAALAEVFDDFIFAPLGMADTQFRVQSNPGPAGGAVGYEGRTEAGFHAPNLEIYEAGDGGVWSTLNDLIRWELNLLSPRVGSAALIARLAEPAQLNDGRLSWYGFGHGTGMRRGVKWFGHAGGLSGMTVNRVHFPGRRLSAIAAGNSGLIDAETLTFAMTDAMLGGVPDASPALEEPSPDEIAALSGVYQAPGQGVVAVVEGRSGGLYLRVHRATVRLMRNGSGVFTDDGGWFRLAARQGGLDLAIGRDAAQVHFDRAPSASAEGEDERLQGRFRSRELNTVYSVERRNGTFWLSIEGPSGGATALPLVRHARDIFEIAVPDSAGTPRPGGIPITFGREGSRASALYVSAQGAERICFERTGA